ncbi:unnamed protein product [Protopolystoma xenopodis]|uniref:Uncharacterized protein n=1 Tax=Protopolystoma xenopodis TaxID=117903 RepID=A0A3S5BB04_9PLAT|nr:unnamed protein product [Protopolystoma xenopodis]
MTGIFKLFCQQILTYYFIFIFAHFVTELTVYYLLLTPSLDKQCNTDNSNKTGELLQQSSGEILSNSKINPSQTYSEVSYNLSVQDGPAHGDTDYRKEQNELNNYTVLQVAREDQGFSDKISSAQLNCSPTRRKKLSINLEPLGVSEYLSRTSSRGLRESRTPTPTAIKCSAHRDNFERDKFSGTPPIRGVSVNDYQVEKTEFEHSQSLDSNFLNSPISPVPVQNSSHESLSESIVSTTSNIQTPKRIAISGKQLLAEESDHSPNPVDLSIDLETDIKSFFDGLSRSQYSKGQVTILILHM